MAPATSKFKQVVAAQGGNPQALDKFELLPNATGMREITSPRAGYVSAIDAEDIGVASTMIGAGRDSKEDAIDPAVGVILEVKVGEKVDAGSVLCRLYYTKEDRVEEAAEHGGRRLPHLRAEARRARTHSGSRRRRWAGSPGLLGLVVILAVAWLFSAHKTRHQAAHHLSGALGLQFAFAVLVLKTDFGKVFQAHRRWASTPCSDYAEEGSQVPLRPAGRPRAGPYGVVFAFQVLPIIIFIASFFSILYYLGVMQCRREGHGDRRCRRSWARAARNR